MKYLRIVIIGLIIPIVFSGCLKLAHDSEQKIVSPQNNDVSIKGKWKIVSYMPLVKEEQIDSHIKSMIGKTAQFSNEASVFDGYYWGNPTYRLRNVNTEEYFLYEYKCAPSKLKIKSERINVITMTSSERYIYEFVIIDNNNMLLMYENVVLNLKKVSDDVELNNIKSLKNIREFKNSQSKDELLRSGVIIGLRAPNGNDKYTYRCLWISSVNKEIHPIIETRGIFLPRRSGFWKVNIESTNSGDKICDTIKASNISIKGEDKVVQSYNIGSNLIKKILYVGNDFISIEVEGEQLSHNRYIMQPIDNIDSNKGIGINDIDEDNGIKAMESGIKRALAENNINESDITNSGTNYKNFALYRKTGHWFLKGRLSYNKAGVDYLSDYNINIIPQKKVVYYDEFCLTWTEIKDKVPEAIDAISSPNRDIALVLTPEKIYVFSIEGRKLSSRPLSKVLLKDGESLIMDEWAVGPYMVNWENIIKNYSN